MRGQKKGNLGDANCKEDYIFESLEDMAGCGVHGFSIDVLYHLSESHKNISIKNMEDYRVSSFQSFQARGHTLPTKEPRSSKSELHQSGIQNKWQQCM